MLFYSSLPLRMQLTRTGKHKTGSSHTMPFACIGWLCPSACAAASLIRLNDQHTSTSSTSLSSSASSSPSNSTATPMSSSKVSPGAPGSSSGWLKSVIKRPTSFRYVNLSSPTGPSSSSHSFCLSGSCRHATTVVRERSTAQHDGGSMTLPVSALLLLRQAISLRQATSMIKKRSWQKQCCCSDALLQ